MARRPQPGARDALLDAARAEFARRGLDGARVEDIARRAGISKGAFYLHFRTKDAAFQEIVQRFLGALEDHAARRGAVEDRLAAEVRSGSRDFRPILAAECAIDVELLELLWRNRQISAAFVSAARPGYRRLLLEFRGRMQALVARRLRDRQGAGVVRPDLDPATAAEIVVGAFEDFARRMADLKERPDLAAWARAFQVLLYEGILDPRAAGGPPPATPDPT